MVELYKPKKNKQPRSPKKYTKEEIDKIISQNEFIDMGNGFSKIVNKKEK